VTGGDCGFSGAICTRALGQCLDADVNKPRSRKVRVHCHSIVIGGESNDPGSNDSKRPTTSDAMYWIAISSRRSHTLNRKRPSGFSTRSTSRNAACLSAKNTTPNWHTIIRSCGHQTAARVHRPVATDAFRPSIRFCTVEHWLIEIRGGNADRLGQRAYQFACHDIGSGRDLEDIAGCHALEPSSQKTRVWFE
jgi:hypothetical protein